MTIEVSGPLSYARCLAVLELLREDERHEPHYRILVDARGIDYSPSVEEVRRLAAALGEHREAFKGCMAVVLDPGPTFDLGQLCARFARGEGFTMACFGAIPQALRWFEENEPAS